MTIGGALDFLFAQLGNGAEPLLPQIQQEMIDRALAAEGGDEVKAARRLGLTRAALRKAKDVDL
jgi:two-component system nitrogen regulation response regulator GlnG